MRLPFTLLILPWVHFPERKAFAVWIDPKPRGFSDADNAAIEVAVAWCTEQFEAGTWHFDYHPAVFRFQTEQQRTLFRTFAL